MFSIVSVDHKPLLKVFGDKPLEEITNPRLQKFKEKAMMYKFQIKHTPGKDNAGADAASRYPNQQPTGSRICHTLLHIASPAPEQDTDVESEVQHTIMAAFSQDDALRAVTWERIVEAGRGDRECTDLAAVISSGFPQNKRDLLEHLRPFWPMRHDLYTVSGIPVKDGRALIPHKLRAETLEALHSAHQGVTGMRALAQNRLFWPGLDHAINLTRAQCRDCNDTAPSQSAEPLIESEIPDFPFQSTATDLYTYVGHKFLIYVDRFTGWSEIAKTPRSDGDTVVNFLRRWFITFGVPTTLSSDGGPPFDGGIYKRFLVNWGVHIRLSSAYFPKSNGRAELAVKSAKRLLMSNIDSMGSLDKDSVSRALLTYRNTPLQDKLRLSPSELLYGRTLNDHLPTVPSQLKVDPKWREMREAREEAMSARLQNRIDVSKEQRKELPPLTSGQHVLVQNGDGRAAKRWGKSGIIVEVLPHRQYRVKVDGSNRVTLRNRVQLKIFTPPSNTFPVIPCVTPSIILDEQQSSHPPHQLTTNRQLNEIPKPIFTSTPSSDQATTPKIGPRLQTTNNVTPSLFRDSHEHNSIDKLCTQSPITTDNDDTIPYDTPTTPMKNIQSSDVRHRQPPTDFLQSSRGKTHR